MAETLDTPKVDGVGRETPVIHGWITLEYAEKMIGELTLFLEKHRPLAKYKWINYGYDSNKKGFFKEEIEP